MLDCVCVLSASNGPKIIRLQMQSIPLNYWRDKRNNKNELYYYCIFIDRPSYRRLWKQYSIVFGRPKFLSSIINLLSITNFHLHHPSPPPHTRWSLIAEWTDMRGKDRRKLTSSLVYEARVRSPCNYIRPAQLEYAFNEDIMCESTLWTYIKHTIYQSRDTIWLQSHVRRLQLTVRICECVTNNIAQILQLNSHITQIVHITKLSSTLPEINKNSKDMREFSPVLIIILVESYSFRFPHPQERKKRKPKIPVIIALTF